MVITRSHIKEICIYTTLTCGGLLVDLGTANLLAYLWGVPLILAGAAGLLTGTITNYFIHLKVTFKHRALSASWKSFGKYVQTCLIGAAVRIGILTILSIFSNFSSFTSLLLATGLSFAVNYLLSRYYVFKTSI